MLIFFVVHDFGNKSHSYFVLLFECWTSDTKEANPPRFPPGSHNVRPDGTAPHLRSSSTRMTNANPRRQRVQQSFMGGRRLGRAAKGAAAGLAEEEARDVWMSCMQCTVERHGEQNYRTSRERLG